MEERYVECLLSQTTGYSVLYKLFQGRCRLCLDVADTVHAVTQLAETCRRSLVEDVNRKFFASTMPRISVGPVCVDLVRFSW